VVAYLQQAPHATRALLRPAQVGAPSVGPDKRAACPHLGDQVPPVIKESDRRQRHSVADHRLLNAPTLGVVGETQLILRTGAVVDGHPDQPVFGVPSVVPTTVALQVAVGVVLEHFRGWGHIDVAGHSRTARHGDAGPQGAVGVVHRDGLAVIFLIAIGGLAVDGDGVGEEAGARDVHEGRHTPADDLVEEVVVGGGGCGQGRNGREAIQVVVCLGGGHARHAVGCEDNLAHEGGIGKQ